jgi:hypothetical protein
MASPRHHKPYPRGDRNQMTPEWKDKVRAALKTRGVSEQWLADQIAKRRGRVMKRDTVNKLLRKQQSSALVPDICAILGLPPPMVSTPDEDSGRALERIMAASPEKRAAILLLLEDNKDDSSR